jgi:hypothetical protein
MGKADMGHQTGLILRYDHGWTDNAISARICRYVSFTFAIAYTSIQNVSYFANCVINVFTSNHNLSHTTRQT